MRLARERSRWFGVVLQPLIFWAVLGFGMSKGFSFSGPNSENYVTYFFPGTIALSILFTTIFSVITIIEDRQAGFLQGVLVAPASRLSIVLGKTAGVLSIALMQVACFLAVSPVAGFHLGQFNWVQIGLVTIAGSVALVALNFVMAWLLNSSQAYHAVMSIVLLPLWVLSGSMFPLKSRILSVVMDVNPIKFLVDGLRDGMNGSSSFGNVTALSLYSVLFLFASTLVLRRTRSEAV